MTLRAAIRAAAATLESLAAHEAAVEQAAALVRRVLGGGGKILVCGNGGSAADGADFVTEIACRFTRDRRPYPAIDLSQGGGLLTAIGNDYGFDEVFARQIRAFGSHGDVVIALSTSGRSANVRRALEQARTQGLDSIALLGRDGGEARGLATVEVIVAGTATARIQEAHKFLLHVICEAIDADL